MLGAAVSGIWINFGTTPAVSQVSPSLPNPLVASSGSSAKSQEELLREYLLCVKGFLDKDPYYAKPYVWELGCDGSAEYLEVCAQKLHDTAGTPKGTAVNICLSERQEIVEKLRADIIAHKP